MLNYVKNNSTEASSSIGPGSVIKGIVSFKGDTIINCSIEGDLSCDASLTIGKESRIRANINSKSVVVFGQVIGNISAENIIEIHPGAKVIGDIKAKRVAMHDGVSFDGGCEMLNTKVVRLADAKVLDSNPKKSGRQK